MSAERPAAPRPYALLRRKTKTGMWYMERVPWLDMSDFGWGFRLDGDGGRRVSPYFADSDMDALRSWCSEYVAAHPGNTIEPEEAERLATAA